MTKYLDPETRAIRGLALLAALTCAALIAHLSLEPSSAVPRFKLSDKLLHFIAYAALTAPLVIAFGRKRVVWAIALAGIYGVFLEFAQGWMTDTRVPSLLDAFANLAGAFTGAAIAIFLVRMMGFAKA